MDATYAMAIDVLKCELDWRSLVFEIAKANPHALVQAATELGWQPPQNWQDECRSLLQEGQKIEAIKLYRSRTGTTLKLALDAINRMETGTDDQRSAVE